MNNTVLKDEDLIKDYGVIMLCQICHHNLGLSDKTGFQDFCYEGGTCSCCKERRLTLPFLVTDDWLPIRRFFKGRND